MGRFKKNTSLKKVTVYGERKQLSREELLKVYKEIHFKYALKGIEMHPVPKH